MQEFNITNLDTFTASSPLFNIVVANPPVYNYTLAGVLPTGLVFSTFTGKITGKVKETTADSRDYTIAATNAYGISNVLDFRINYSVAKKPKITYPLGDVIPSYVSQITTLASPLLTIQAEQALGGTDNFDPALTDETRNKYTAVGLPPGLVLDLYTGKIYGQLATSELPSNPTTTYTLSYSVKLIASNPVGASYTSIQLIFSSTGTPVITNIPAGYTKYLDKNREYTSTSPLQSVLATNTPTSYAATNLPTGMACSSSGKLVGIVYDNTPAGNYEVELTATNSVGTSPIATLKVNVPISITSPIAGTVYNTYIDNPDGELFDVSVCPTLDNSLVNIVVTGLPTGVVYQNGKVSGVPTTVGSNTITISASTENYGDKIVVVTLVTAAVPPADVYTISGKVEDTAQLPVSKVLITDGNRDAYTNTAGIFYLKNSPAGAYNIVASKGDYTTLPVYRQIQITDSDVSNVDFTLESPGGGVFKYKISGYVKDETDAPSANVEITDGSRVVYTNTQGIYEFINTPVGSYNISASFGNAPIVPAYRIAQVVTSDVINIDFTLQTTTPTRVIRGNVALADGVSPAVGVLLVSGNQTTTTTALGEYLFYTPQGADIVVEPQSDLFIFTPASVLVTAAQLAAGSVIIPTFIANEIMISGKILLDGVTPVSGVKVSVDGSIVSTNILGVFSKTTARDADVVVEPQSYNYSFSPASITVTIAELEAGPVVLPDITATKQIFELSSITNLNKKLQIGYLVSEKTAQDSSAVYYYSTDGGGTYTQLTSLQLASVVSGVGKLDLVIELSDATNTETSAIYQYSIDGGVTYSAYSGFIDSCYYSAGVKLSGFFDVDGKKYKDCLGLYTGLIEISPGVWRSYIEGVDQGILNGYSFVDGYWYVYVQGQPDILDGNWHNVLGDNKCYFFDMGEIDKTCLDDGQQVVGFADGNIKTVYLTNCGEPVHGIISNAIVEDTYWYYFNMGEALLYSGPAYIMEEGLVRNIEDGVPQEILSGVYTLINYE